MCVCVCVCVCRSDIASPNRAEETGKALVSLGAVGVLMQRLVSPDAESKRAALAALAALSVYPDAAAELKQGSLMQQCVRVLNDPGMDRKALRDGMKIITALAVDRTFPSFPSCFLHCSGVEVCWERGGLEDENKDGREEQGRFLFGALLKCS